MAPEGTGTDERAESPGRWQIPLWVACGAIVVSVIIWRGLAPLAGYDIWWQLATGREMWSSGSWLPTDPFSHTQLGRDWPYKDAGFSLVVWAIDQASGSAGLVLAKCLTHLSIFVGLAGLVARRVPQAHVVIVSVALVYAASAFRCTERPQVLSFVLLVAVLAVLERRWQREAADDPPRQLLSVQAGCTLTVLCWVNANLHRAGLLLPWVVLGFGVAMIVERFGLRAAGRRPAWLWWRNALAWSFVCAGVCLINPSGWNIVTTSVAMVDDPVLHAAIPEWWSATPGNITRAAPAIWGVLAVLLLAALSHGRRWRAWDWMLVALALAVSFRGVRFLPYLPMLVVLPVATAMGNARTLKRPVLTASLPMGAAAAMVLWTLGSGLPEPRLGPALDRYPESGVDFVRHHQPKGAMYNDFGVGGYLIHELAGQREDDRVFIDGRNDIVYPQNFIRRYTLSKSDPRMFSELVAEFDVQWLFLDNRADDYSRAFIDSDDTWALVHVGGQSLIYVRRHGRNEELIRTRAYKILQPHIVSPTLMAAAQRPDTRALMLEELARARADDPQSRFARIASAKFLSLLGPAHQQALQEQLDWLDQKGEALAP